MEKLPEEYIVSCRNIYECNKVNQYYYACYEYAILVYPTKYIVCSKDCLIQNMVLGMSLQQEIPTKFEHLRLFTYDEWEKLCVDDALNVEFVPYELSKQLKEIGFNDECLGRYVNGELLNYKDNNNDDHHSDEIINAPLFQQIFRWFRVKHMYHLNGLIEFSEHSFVENNQWKYTIYGDNIQGIWYGSYGDTVQGGWYGSYGEAEFACLKKLIKLANPQLK